MGMWVQQVSAWKQMENWRAKQQSINDQLDTMASVTQTLADAGSSYYDGIANIGAQLALKRVTEAATAKRQKTLDDIDQSNRKQAELDAVKERLQVPAYVRVIAGKRVNVTV